ncbi:hypothetical protein LZC95_39790 [Pendulispora brunnea]|uniref:Uncharacterized protein n=1 Tax=Pendulispora brunnea TaxID=2905690 RepID=A0ABZ2K1T4_9BACT
MVFLHRGMNIARAFLALVLIPACSSATNTPETPAKGEKRQVFVEMAIFRVSRDFAGPMPRPDDGDTLNRLLEDPRVTLVSTPHMLATDGYPVTISGSIDGRPGTRIVVIPTIDPQDAIHLDLDLSIHESDGRDAASARRLATRTTVTVGDHQFLTGALQAVPPDPNERWLFTLDAQIVRSRADLKKLFEEKQRQREESIRRAKGG